MGSSLSNGFQTMSRGVVAQLLLHSLDVAGNISWNTTSDSAWLPMDTDGASKPPKGGLSEGKRCGRAFSCFVTRTNRLQLCPLRATPASNEGVIFVVDSHQPDGLHQAREELRRICEAHPQAPLLVLANHPGRADPGRGAEAIAALELPALAPGRKWFVQDICTTTGEGFNEGLEWLARCLKQPEADPRGPLPQ